MKPLFITLILLFLSSPIVSRSLETIKDVCTLKDLPANLPEYISKDFKRSCELKQKFNNYLTPELKEELHILHISFRQLWKDTVREKNLIYAEIDNSEEQITLKKENLKENMARFYKVLGELDTIANNTIPHILGQLEIANVAIIEKWQKGKLRTEKSYKQSQEQYELGQLHKEYTRAFNRLKKSALRFMRELKAYASKNGIPDVHILQIVIGRYLMNTENKSLFAFRDSIRTVENKFLFAFRDSIRTAEFNLNMTKKEVENLELNLAKNQQELNRIDSQLTSKNDLIRVKDSILKSKNSLLFSKDSQLKVKERAIVEINGMLEASIQTKNRLIQESNKNISVKDNLINTAAEEIKNKEKEVGELKNWTIGLILVLVCSVIAFIVMSNLTKQKASALKTLQNEYIKLENSEKALQKMNEKLVRAQKRVEESNSQLAQARDELAEKNTKLNDYLKELSHRVKNNLQDINSLLSLQAIGIRDTEAQKVLTQAQERIRAIGLIHKHLYAKNQKRLTTIDFKRYIYDLVEFLCASDVGRMVEKHLDLQEIHLEISSATNIGLIINEIISNCFKHAFPYVLKQEDKPELHIKAFLKDGSLCVLIRDNGPGIEQNGKYSKEVSFGQTIINALVEHEKGKMYVALDLGTEYKLEFPLEQKEYIIA